MEDRQVQHIFESINATNIYCLFNAIIKIIDNKHKQRAHAQTASDNRVSDSALDGGRDVVVLNVGGTIHQVRWDTIDKFPNSRLQKLRYAASDCECS